MRFNKGTNYPVGTLYNIVLKTNNRIYKVCSFILYLCLTTTCKHKIEGLCYSITQYAISK